MIREDILASAEQILSGMLKGKRIRELFSLEELPEDMKDFGRLFNTFISDIVECQDFIDELSDGNLEAQTPSRKNYAAGPLKELHSQLISMSTNIKDLSNGKMVSKLYYPGELFDNYNKLITMISDMLKDRDNDNAQAVSSWSYHRVLSAINQLTTMIVQYDEHGKLVFANVIAKERLEGIESLISVENSQDHDLRSYLGKFTPIINRLKPHEILNSRFPVKKEIHDTKNDAWYSIHTDVARLDDGTIGVIHMIDDISEWKYTEQELKNEASLDPLTSAFTRKVGDKKFKELINHREKSENCVGFVDMDGLKQINDNHGHTEGDFAIKTVATVLMSAVRDTDWVVRYGGDEFLILFKDCCEADANNIIDRMYDHLEGLNNSLHKPYEIQFSVGLIQITNHMDDMQKIIDIVDEKMYQHKMERKKK